MKTRRKKGRRETVVKKVAKRVNTLTVYLDQPRAQQRLLLVRGLLAHGDRSGRCDE